MLSIRKMGFLGLGVAAGLFAAGCSSNTPPQSSLEPSPQGLTCTKCQVTWVQVPTTNGKHVTGYKWTQKDTCPDCMDSVTSFFNTGKFEHTCKACGGNMEVCEAHPK